MGWGRDKIETLSEWQFDNNIVFHLQKKLREMRLWTTDVLVKFKLSTDNVKLMHLRCNFRHIAQVQYRSFKKIA